MTPTPFLDLLVAGHQVRGLRTALRTATAVPLAEGQVDNCTAIGILGEISSLELGIRRKRIQSFASLGVAIATGALFWWTWADMGGLSKGAFGLLVMVYELGEINLWRIKHRHFLAHLEFPRLRLLAAARPDVPRDPLSTATTVFTFFEALLPRRLTAEQFGDALELIAHLRLAGRPRWLLHLKIASTVFWVLVDAARELQKCLLGKH